MSTITTRAGKGTPLTHNEVDANFTNLNADKLEISGGTVTGNLGVTGNLTVDTSTLFVDAANNRVGIGKTNPATALDVNGTVTADGLSVQTADLGTTAGDSVQSLSLRSDTSNADFMLFTAERISTGTSWTTAAHKMQRKVDATLMGYMQFGSATSDLITFGENATEYMRIDGSGNVGIGTSSPAATLDVAGTGAVKVPVGTDAQRPSAVTGLFRFNTTSGAFEGYDGSAWGSIGGGGGGLFKGENGETGDTTNGAGDIFRINEQTLNTSVTIDADENASATGPLAVASGVTLTVTSGGNLSIV